MTDFEDIRRIWGKERTRDIDLIKETIHQLNLDVEARILDIGTGWGTMSISLALSGFKVLTGEPENWNKSHERLEWHQGDQFHENHVNWKKIAKDLKVEHKIEYRKFDAIGLPFADESFDAIFMYNTLHHIPDKKGALTECFRVINRDGVICVIEMNKNGIEHFRKSHGFKHEVINPEDIVEGNAFTLKTTKGQYADAFIFKKSGETW